MNKIRVIIWDLDKTLYPFDRAFGIASQRALAAMIAEMNIGMSPAQATSYAQTVTALLPGGSNLGNRSARMLGLFQKAI